MDGVTNPDLQSPDGPLGELVERFRTAWRDGGAAEITTFVPLPGDTLRRAALMALVKVDLEMRWRRGQTVTLENYLEQFPDLAPDGDWPVGLLYEEYRVRQQYGDYPSLASYQTRFPKLFDQLRRLVAAQPIGTLMHSGPDGGTLPSRPGTPPAAPSPIPARTTPTPVVSASEPMPLPPASPPVSPAPGPPLGPQSRGPSGSDYTLEKLIGRGGFGEVWRALSPGGIPVAVKIIDRPADHEARVREERALEVIKQCKHHFLVQTHAFWADADRLFIVMDLAEGSLRDRLGASRKAGQRGVPQDELLVYFREAAEALDYLHAKGVLHRDIKPDNLLLIEGHLRLADFGLARHQEQRMMTVSGSGTPAYMAPETWRGRAGNASDQYALAYSYAELRLGRRPFTSNDYAAVMFDHLEHTPDLGNLPEAEKKVLLRALAKDPAKRFPTCTDFARALQAAAGGEAGAPAVEPAPARKGAAGSPGPSEKTYIGGTLIPGQESDSPTDRLAEDSATYPMPPPAPPRPPDRRRRKVLLLVLLAAVVLGGTAVGALILSSRRLSRHELHLKVPAELTLRPGEEKELVVEVERKGFDAPVRLTFTAPAGVEVAEAEVPKGEKQARVLLRARRDAAGSRSLTINAEGGGGTDTADVRLVIETAASTTATPWVPTNGRGVGQPVTIGGQQWYPEVVVRMSGAPEVPFVLIAQEQKTDPPTFYIMRYKVSNDLFAVWFKAARKKFDWSPAGGGSLPALDMTANQAEEMAQWLGGKLPTPPQWDAAAGLSRREGRAGPAKGPAVAIRRRGQGPLAVAQDNDDVSPRGVYGMAGNGTELTRQRDKVKVDGVMQEVVILRGKRWTAPAALTYQDLEEQRTDLPQVQYASQASPFTGFRVVLEPEVP